VALYLAAAGVGRIGIIDPDRVDETNLQRQILFDESDIGSSKALSAQRRLTWMNSDLLVDAIPERLTAANALSIISGYDLVVDGTDNFAAKFLINDAAYRLGRPVIFASISRMEGQMSVFCTEEGPCYRCLYPSPPKAWVPNCAEAGVLGPVAGVMGSMQAVEAIKLLVGLPTLAGRLLMWDALRMQTRTMTLSKRPGCTICSRSREAVELSDLVEQCESQADALEVTAHELQELIRRQKVQLIDVRELEEWHEGHLPDAMHFPLSSLKRGEMPHLRSQETVVLYCQSGKRSRQAIELLVNGQDISIETLAHLRGGLNSWPNELTPKFLSNPQAC
jgi:adenylyltransferase/sulfurtransferase